MFRKVLALGLFASLLLSGMFFSPVYKAEESEEFYEDQPYLYYDLHIHELDYKHMERCVNDEKYKNIPAIIISTLAQEEEKRKGFEAGADRYIVKSAFDKDTLLTAVESLIGSN